jgi:hypothetical protein
MDPAVLHCFGCVGDLYQLAGGGVGIGEGAGGATTNFKESL